MSKYILLLGSYYYPSGWDDFRGVFDSGGSARGWLDELNPEDFYDAGWFEIISTESWKVVKIGGFYVEEDSLVVEWATPINSLEEETEGAPDN